MNTIRICEHCIRLLETRKEMQDSRTFKPPIVHLYNDIQELKKEIKPDIEIYIKMINSLYDGDSIFTIADVSKLKAKIGRVAELIDLKTKQILALPPSSQIQQQHQVQHTREDALKKAIRMACVKYIKDEMLSIPPIPVEEEIRKIQEKRRKETEQRIERERRLALEAYEKYGLVESNTMVHGGNSNFASGVSEEDKFFSINYNYYYFLTFCGCIFRKHGSHRESLLKCTSHYLTSLDFSFD